MNKEKYDLSVLYNKEGNLIDIFFVKDAEKTHHYYQWINHDLSLIRNEQKEIVGIEIGGINKIIKDGVFFRNPPTKEEIAQAEEILKNIFKDWGNDE